MPNQLSAVDDMVLALRSEVADLLPAPCVFRFELCVTEALSNLAVHAKTTIKDAAIDIDLRISTTEVAVDIYDPEGAAAFDMTADSHDLSQVDLMAEGGRGLGLIQECSNRVSYGHKNGRNCLSLLFTPQVQS